MPADYEGIGYALRDLARLYQGGQPGPPRVDSRLKQALVALRGANLVPEGPLSGMSVSTPCLVFFISCMVTEQNSLPGVPAISLCLFVSSPP